MRTIRVIVALLAFASLTACARVSFAIANLPAYFGTTRVFHDVRFGAGREQKLDIYVPSGTNRTRYDVVVFLYGGRWTSGSKDDYRFVGDAFAKRGFVTVIPDYSKYPAVKFPVFVQDGAGALAWVADNIEKFGGDRTRIHLAGHSSGAHIGGLLNADARYLAAFGKSRSAVIHDFTGLAGPYSFEPDEPDLEDMFGPPANYPQMQATTFIDGKQPPMLLMWGADDKDVGRINLTRMVQSIAAKGGCLETKIYPATDHVGIVAGLSWINPARISVLQDMTSYFDSHPAQGECPALGTE